MTFSFSGYFQNERVLPSSTTHLRCHAPNPDTSSNIVKKPRFDTWTYFNESVYQFLYNSSNLALAVTVQLKIDISIERGNIRNPLKSPLLL